MSRLGLVTTRLTRRPALVAAVMLAVVVVWLASGVVAPSKRVAETAAPATRVPAPTAVQVTPVPAEWVERTVTLSGRTAPARTVEIKAETGGRVIAVGAERGARLEQGTVIVQIESGDRGARLEQARAEVRQRELEYEGQLKLKPAGYVSDAKLAESLALLAKARTEAARAGIDIARTRIVAPFAGALQDRRVEVGDYVPPGAAVATVVDNRTLAVAGSVAEAQITGVRSGLVGRARLTSGQVINGTLRYVAPVADSATRTFAVELEVPNPGGLLQVGVTAYIELPVGRVRAHRVSPALLTLDDAGVVGVKLLAAGNHVRFVPANIVRSSTDGVWLSGLPDPAPVIVAGAGFVRDGDQVAATLTTAVAPDLKAGVAARTASPVLRP